jgi:hypothetical protein
MVSTRLTKCFFFLVVGIALLALLTACGDEVATPTELAQVTIVPTAIPTFTPVPATPIPTSTPTPTLIVLPPTVTPSPTASPTPVIALLPTPTLSASPSPSVSPRPSATPVNSPFKTISAEQARNLDGYRTLLPTYVPSGFKLTRITLAQTVTPRLITVICEFDDEQGRVFYISAQALPGLATVAGSSFSNTPAASLSPTASANFFRQETILVRGHFALLSYTDSQATLSWTEGVTNYFVNGALTRADILLVAESLA